MGVVLKWQIKSKENRGNGGGTGVFSVLSA